MRAPSSTLWLLAFTWLGCPEHKSRRLLNPARGLGEEVALITGYWAANLTRQLFNKSYATTFYPASVDQGIDLSPNL